MEIFYIGDNARRLLSIFHAGNERKIKRTAVIICNPLGHEYIRFYKAISILAKELSMNGFSTFRFDYYGTGDSYGDETEFDLSSSREDLKQVVKEVKEGCDVDNICLIGIRYGCILSLSLEDLNVNSLILWNPFLSGEDYIKEISQNHNEFVSGSFVMTKKNLGFESLGFIYSKHLLPELKKFHIKYLSTKLPYRILILADKEVLAKGFNNYPIFSNNKSDIIENSISRFWLKKKGQQEKSIVPLSEIHQIINWLSKFV
ncbi:serine aminopeptidase domain-containing protein [Pedobacter kyonggii]|uniref:Serine aminopeptidase S33 domain-containing protein n=1 Tax=Pedobacter kyonggii TaxID=1926871 RepID=A0A4V2JH77_9SPHI|nr:alpha/beta hydrolase [Pedobacter kyonggii]TBO44301.1 hypothetical protein EYS08_03030 [Pedobacter kyonggii]